MNPSDKATRGSTPVETARRRRDPRQEWIARNRLHPQHQSVLAALEGATSPPAWMGPQGRLRRNPHAVGFIGPNGRRRIDRSGVQAGATASPAGRAQTATVQAARDRRRAVTLEAPAGWIAVVPDTATGRLTEHDRDLFGLARRLADSGSKPEGAELAVVAILFGDSPPPALEQALGEAGADRVVCLAVAEGYAPEARLAACTRVDDALAPRHWLFPDTALDGGDLGRRLAVRLGERPACGVWRVEADGGLDAGGSCVCRTGSGREDQPRPLPRILMALAECAEPVVETRHEARAMAQEPPHAPQAPQARLEDLGAVAVDPAEIALHEAPFILSGGNGVGDWPGFHRAAQALGASEGASRVAVDDGNMPRHRQVGATGTFVSARVYLAVGISGAIQHLQGIQRCDKVIAVNRDPGCDMVKRADLSVIGNGDEILAELVRLVEARGERGGKGDSERGDTHESRPAETSPKEALNVA
ncbi:MULTISPECIES: electron transfer flavoprotein subunit alpha/FixB family protein [unclassified Halomonas]|uniref:electron transfer flavoprotein subunit alpha/FixB family protein n=2 Tax=Halomonas TaxID=2745 RepID=UPI000A069961|nr:MULTISPECIES: electron transfer flavoprotein subunit alpha/FixB family protein [unclassified Halomonas]